MTYKKILVFCIAFATFHSVGKAQDLHYSQFYNAPLVVNPALTGIFKGDKRVSVSLRDQWRSVPVPWFTFTLGYDQKVYLNKRDDLFLGLGGFFNFDQQGDSKLNLGSLNLSGSISKILSQKHIITGGLTLGYANKGFNDSALTWDTQFTGGTFDPMNPSGESFNFTRIGYIETALGLNYRYQKTRRTKMDIGVGAWHLTTPEDQFYNRSNNQELPVRLSIYGIGSVELADKLDLELDLMVQDQASYKEIIFGAYLDIYLDKDRGEEKNLHLGAGYRTSGAIYPKIALEWQKRFFVALSYDIDLSEFNRHTNYRGGPEIHFNYLITDVKPLKPFKVCPIY